MEIKYEITGKARKSFAKAVGEITGEPPKYLGAPTFAYKVEPGYVITRDGNLDVSDKADSREVKNLIERLAEKGFIGAEMPAGLLKNEPAEKLLRKTKASRRAKTQGLQWRFLLRAYRSKISPGCWTRRAVS